MALIGPGHPLSQVDRQRCWSARSCNRCLHVSFADALLDARDFALYETPHLGEFVFLGRIVLQEILGEAHRSDGQTDHVVRARCVAGEVGDVGHPGVQVPGDDIDTAQGMRSPSASRSRW